MIGNKSPIEYFESLAAQSRKPLLFTELGYANDSGAAADPSASGNSPEPTLQAELYQAFFQAWAQSGDSSLIGAYFWEWDPNGSTSNVGPEIDSFSPQNSPAQAQATAGFEAQSASSSFADPGISVIDGTVDASTLLFDSTHTVILAGGTIEGSAAGETLDNAGSTILGAGTIGDGIGHLILDNASGTIEASGGTLALDTGATITNSGTLEAAAGATLQVDDPVIGAGSATIGVGATVEFGAANSKSVTFNGPPGTLILDHSSTFSGEIFNFTGDGSLSGSDKIDLLDINYNSVEDSYANGVLTVTDGTDTANITFDGSYTLENFKLASDGNGGTIIYDPPVPGTSETITRTIRCRSAQSKRLFNPISQKRIDRKSRPSTATLCPRGFES